MYAATGFRAVKDRERSGPLKRHRRHGREVLEIAPGVRAAHAELDRIRGAARLCGGDPECGAEGAADPASVLIEVVVADGDAGRRLPGEIEGGGAGIPGDVLARERGRVRDRRRLAGKQ